MNLELMWQSVPELLGGLGLTLQLVALSLLFGFFLAVGVALMRLSPNRILAAVDNQERASLDRGEALAPASRHGGPVALRPHPATGGPEC